MKRNSQKDIQNKNVFIILFKPVANKYFISFIKLHVQYFRKHRRNMKLHLFIIII